MFATRTRLGHHGPHADPSRRRDVAEARPRGPFQRLEGATPYSLLTSAQGLRSSGDPGRRPAPPRRLLAGSGRSSRARRLEVTGVVLAVSGDEAVERSERTIVIQGSPVATRGGGRATSREDDPGRSSGAVAGRRATGNRARGRHRQSRQPARRQCRRGDFSCRDA